MSRVVSQTINLQNPKEQVSKYITDITERGISIHPQSLVNTTSVQLDGTGLDVIKGTISVAKYSDIVRIGKTDKTRIEIDYHSFKQKDNESNNYVYFSDLRDETGYATFTESFVGDGTNITFQLQIFVGTSINEYDITSEDITVTVDGIEKVFNTDYIVNTISIGALTPPIPYSQVRFQNAPASNAIIEITYRTVSDKAKAFTIGSRNGSCGAHSWTVGYECDASGVLSYASGARTQALGKCSCAQNQDTIANGDYQTVIGRCNRPDTTSVFIIGNGKTKGMRENALSVDWKGNLYLYFDTWATSGTDYQLYQAISSLGWSDVIINN